MENPGEELVGSYLREILDCSFVGFNINTKFTQGEIDVVGINYEKKNVYICEVATHLETGLQYTKERRPDNINRFVRKFEKDIKYGEKYLAEFTKVYMLWSPIVKTGREGSKYNQLNDIKSIQKLIREQFNVDLHIIINEEYMKCINELRKIALKRTDEIRSPILRFMQIEEKLRLHISRMNKNQKVTNNKII